MTIIIVEYLVQSSILAGIGYLILRKVKKPLGRLPAVIYFCIFFIIIAQLFMLHREFGLSQFPPTTFVRFYPVGLNPLSSINADFQFPVGVFFLIDALIRMFFMVIWYRFLLGINKKSKEPLEIHISLLLGVTFFLFHLVAMGWKKKPSLNKTLEGKSGSELAIKENIIPTEENTVEVIKSPTDKFFPKAFVAIGFRNDVKVLWDKAIDQSNGIEQLKVKFLQILENQPKIKSEELEKAFLKNVLEPYPTARLNETLKFARRFGEEGEKEFTKIVEILGDEASLVSLKKHIIEKFGNQRKVYPFYPYIKSLEMKYNDYNGRRTFGKNFNSWNTKYISDIGRSFWLRKCNNLNGLSFIINACDEGALIRIQYKKMIGRKTVELTEDISGTTTENGFLKLDLKLSKNIELNRNHKVEIIIKISEPNGSSPQEYTITLL